jgi:succinoglycan biosynthesis transport protein ExoP
MFLMRSEKQFVTVLGQPLLAVRPIRPETTGAQAEQLHHHWFSRQRLLPVVSAESGEGRTRLALDLARKLAASGVRTLLVDGDLRSPGLHRALRLPNRQGLADFLAGRDVKPTQCADNLAVLVAGGTPAEPLEALASPRLRPLLSAAATRFGAIVIDTPAARRGPDLQIFAALAGGALVLHGGAGQPALERLRRSLQACAAQVVGILRRD